MYREIRILLIDDDETRRHDLKVILDFVGEETVACSSSSWKEAVPEGESDSFSCLLLGTCNGSPADVAKAVLEWEKKIPIILVSGTEIPDSDPACSSPDSHP